MLPFGCICLLPRTNAKRSFICACMVTSPRRPPFVSSTLLVLFPALKRGIKRSSFPWLWLGAFLCFILSCAFFWWVFHAPSSPPIHHPYPFSIPIHRFFLTRLDIWVMGSGHACVRCVCVKLALFFSRALLHKVPHYVHTLFLCEQKKGRMIYIGREGHDFELLDTIIAVIDTYFFSAFSFCCCFCFCISSSLMFNLIFFLGEGAVRRW